MNRLRNLVVTLLVAFFLSVSGIALADLNDGLVGYYTFDNTLSDFSGNNYSAIFPSNSINQPTYVDAVIGNGLRFDGNDYLQIPYTFFANSVSDLTFSTWARIEQSVPSTDVAPFMIETVPRMGGDTQMNTRGFAVKLAGQDWYRAETQIPTNEYVHLTGVYRRGDSIELWINGERKVSTPIPALDLYTVSSSGYTHPDLESRIGAYGHTDPPQPEYAFNGVLDEIRIYNRALSGSEISSLMNLSPLPTVAKLAALSNDVYGVNKGPIGNYSIVNVGPHDWKNGFAANVYHDGEQYVIAVRGTYTNNLSNSAYNILSDLSFAKGSPEPDSNLVAGVKYLAELVKQIHADHPDAIITLTGHSLGGAIAQIVGHYDGLQAMTFDAPGPAAFLPYFDKQTQLFQSGIPSPSSQITDYRLFGDQISRVGGQLGTTITYDNPNGVMFANNPFNLKANHDLFTLLQQIVDNTSGYTNGVPMTDISWLDKIVFAVKDLTSGLLKYTLSIIADAAASYIFDPPAGASYSIVEQNESPEIASIQLPVYGSVAGWELKYLSDDGWHDYALATNGFFDFGSGAMEVDFYPVDPNGNAIAQADPFLFDLTFVSAGSFSAALDVVPSSSVPEPATMLLLGFGLMGLAGARRKFKK